MLYAPPLATIDTGITSQQSLAELQYYDSDQLSRKRGSIDLTQCEEVLQKLGSQQYPYVFGLRTKHSGRMRTYYLAADSEEEMNKWVETLCRVLHLDCKCRLFLLLVDSMDVRHIYKTRMWANAQPDGRPAEHRWRPLFNAAKFA